MRVCSCNAMEKAWLRRTQERVGGTGPGGGGNQTEIAGWRGSWTQAQIPPLTSPDSDAGPREYLYCGAEMLPGPQEGRSRHRSGVDSAVTETEPRDSVVLSRDDGFFMPFGNTENLAG